MDELESNGQSRLRKKVEYLQALKKYCISKIDQYDCFVLLAPSEYLNILFRYEPNNALNEDELAQLNISICTQLKKDGSAFIDYASYKGRTGIRLILGNGEAEESDIDSMLKHCQLAGDNNKGDESLNI